MPVVSPGSSPRLLLERKVQRLRELTFTSSERAHREKFLPELIAAEKELAGLAREASPLLLRRVIPSPSGPAAGGSVSHFPDNVRGSQDSPRGAFGSTRGASGSTRGAQDNRVHQDNVRGEDTTALIVEASLRMAHVPTGLIHLLEPDKHPLLTFRVRNVRRTTARLRFTSFVEGYSARAIDILEVAPGGSDTLHHLPAFFLEKTREVTEICRAALHIQVEDLAPEGQIELHQTIPLWLLARTSAYLSVHDPETGGAADLSSYLGAWVTPNRPEVHTLLRQAAEHAPGRAITSYQVDAQGVEAQVSAIYQTLQGLDITYVNSVLTMGAVPGLLMQRVRLPRQSIAERAANCLDGTVLMASLLEAASLQPALVLIPGHALLGWQSADGGGSWDYVETTQLGSKPFAEARALGKLTAEHFESQLALADGRGEPLFKRLPLAELRRQCILPME